ncbi:MAG: lysophospholipid acyltransferase family protein [Acidobacteriota bacterium]
MPEARRDIPLLRRMGYRALASLARLICLSLRLRRENAGALEAIRAEGKNCVIAFWHGSMIPGWFFHRPEGEEQASALVSLSKDGTILASVLEDWGFELIRGSSHVGGREALHRMTDLVKEGRTLVMTPDGPRGPRHVMKAGAALAAHRAGVPLVMAGIAIERKKVFPKSWDKFEMPLPFSRVCIWYDTPFMPESDGSGAQEPDRQAFEQWIRTLEARLNDLQTKAHRALGIQEPYDT